MYSQLCVQSGVTRRAKKVITGAAFAVAAVVLAKAAKHGAS